MNTPIIFPITYRCNLSCSYCHQRLNKTDISIKKSICLIDKLNNEWVYITGGEPLILDEIYDVCDRLRSSGKKVGLTTNGTIHKYDIVNYVDRIGVSIDGPRDINDMTRGVGNYNKSITFLENIAGKTEVGIMCTVGDWNKDRLSEVEEIGNKYKCDFVQFTDVH